MPCAAALNGAFLADRVAGPAKQGTELHHGRIPLCGCLWIVRPQFIAEGSFGLCDVRRGECLTVPMTLDDSAHIGIQGECALMESEGGNGSGGVLANARQGDQFLDITRHLAGVLCGDDACALPKPTCPAGITQPIPHFQGFANRAVSQLSGGGPALYPGFPPG